MRLIGFSTGALARGDFRLALDLLRSKNVRAVELSALRERELPPLIEALDDLSLDQFEYVAFHAPSALADLSEKTVVRMLLRVTDRSIPVVVHPDVIREPGLWRDLGSFLCLENMDRRKTAARTSDELKRCFHQFPDATWCFDVGHANHVDPTMCEATKMLLAFPHRLRQLHASTVNTSGGHQPLTYGMMRAVARIQRHISTEAPVILEACIQPGEIEEELSSASLLFSRELAEKTGTRITHVPA